MSLQTIMVSGAARCARPLGILICCTTEAQIARYLAFSFEGQLKVCLTINHQADLAYPPLPNWVCKIVAQHSMAAIWWAFRLPGRQQ